MSIKSTMPTSSSRSPSSSLSSLPCLATPDSLIFHKESVNSHKQIMTIFNPFDFPLTFKVFSTAPKQYIVRPFQGSLHARSSLDVIIRLNVDTVAKFLPVHGKESKFMVEITGTSGKLEGQAGKKVIMATLMPGSVVKESNTTAAVVSTGESGRSSSSNDDEKGKKDIRRSSRPVSSSSNVLFSLLVVCCVVVVMAPLDSSNESFYRTSTSLPIPHFLEEWARKFTFTISHKLMAAYLLGMITMAILRGG